MLLANPRGRRTGGRWLAFLLAAVAWGDTPSWIDRYAAESAAANQSCNSKDYPVCRSHLTQLLDLLDGRADIVYRLARVDALLGNQVAALDGLIAFSNMKLPFQNPGSDSAFANLAATPEFPAIRSRLDAARKPVSVSRPFLTLPEKDLVAEDIACDPPSHRFFISSVRHGIILFLTRDGTASEFLPEGTPGVWAVLALRVDPKRRFLWATTAAMPERLGTPKEDLGRSALLQYSLDSRALLKRYDLPRDAEHALGDMTLGPAGDVFVSDGHGPVYWLDHRTARLETLVPAGTFRSPQTPALSPDGRRLFVPDYSRGIGIIDLATRQVKLIPHPRDLSLAGIDGLYLVGRAMLAVQNGTSPPRLIRLLLNSSLTAIESFEVLEANWPGLGAQTHGVLVSDRFYFIANSGWDRLADDGQLKPGAVFEFPTIRQLDLRGIAASPIPR